MGNSFKLIKYIGIGAVVMIVIAFAMFAMKGFDTFIAEDSEALEVIDSHEVYVKVSPYEGRIMGSKVRRLIDAIYKLYNVLIEKMNEIIPNTNNVKYPVWCWVKYKNQNCPPKRKGEPVMLEISKQPLYNFY